MNALLSFAAAALALGALPLLACSAAPVQADTQLADANAAPGAAIYRRACAGCHGRNGEGMGSAPPVMGSAAMNDRFETAAELYAYVSREMPLPKAKVGSLPADEYWAVVNYMLIGHGSSVPPGGVNEQNASGVRVAPPR